MGWERPCAERIPNSSLPGSRIQTSNISEDTKKGPKQLLRPFPFPLQDFISMT